MSNQGQELIKLQRRLVKDMEVIWEERFKSKKNKIFQWITFIDMTLISTQ